MSDKPQENAESRDGQEARTTRRPDFGAYNVKDGANGNAYWTQVGAAWSHKDGKGYDLDLDSVPVNGRVVLRELRDQRMDDYGKQREAQQAQQEREPSQTLERSNQQSHER